MADYDVLTYHRVTGLFDGIVADSPGPLGDPGTTPDLYTVNMPATIALGVARNGRLLPNVPEVRLVNANPPRTLLLVPIRAGVESGVFKLPGATDLLAGVDVVAKSSLLPLQTDDQLIATVTFDPTPIGGSTYTFSPVSYVVPTVEPADYAAGRIQDVTFTGNKTGGTWVLVYGNQPTINLAWNTTALAVQNGLRAIPDIGNNVTVAGNDGGPFVVTFGSAIARPLILGAFDNLTGTNLPGVKVTDRYTPVTVDLTTVERWVAAA